MGETAPRPRKSLGQHFLSDPSILERIVRGAGVAPGDRVLEIGPGPGGLTRALLAAGARVWAVEADPRMVEHLARESLPGLHLTLGDALKADYRAVAAAAGGPLKLVANLPYNISGPLLARLLRQRDALWSMTVMLQREVADRLVAPPGTRARGGLSALAQCFCSVRPVLRVPPGAFRPPPRVDSRVVRLDVLPGPVAPLADEGLLWAAVRAGFGQRRKMLRNTLKPLAPDPTAVLEAAGVRPTDRAEDLDAGAWIRVANALAGEGGG